MRSGTAVRNGHSGASSWISPWIHCGASSQPVAGAIASYATGAELIKRARLSKPAVARVLFGPSGPITPRLLKRSIVELSNYIVVEVGGEVWLATVPAGQDPRHGSS